MNTETVGGGRLQGRTIVVTGGGHGIGRAYCLRLAAEGAAVVVVDIDGAAAATVARRISDEHGQAMEVALDVTDLAALRQMSESAVERFGGIDGLVNNAGMLTILPISRVGFEDIPEAEWDRVIDVNLKGTWFACRAVVPHLRARGGGSIVNIGSGTSFNGSPSRVHYVASKGAIIGFTRTLARELGPDGIRVNTLVPGSTLSEEDPSPQIMEMRQRQAASRAFPRVERPEDLTGTAVYLLSDDSAYVTGQAIVVEGGGIMH